MRCRLVSFVLLCALFAGPPLRAEGVGDAGQQAVARGEAAIKAGDWPEALRAWTTARRFIAEVPDRSGLIGNIGLCFAMVGHPAEALDHFREAHRLATVLPPPDNTTREARLARIAPYLAQLGAVVGRVEVSCDAPLVELAIGDRPLGMCTRTVEVDPGDGVIVGRAVDGTARRAAFAVVSGGQASIALRFHDTGDPPPPPRAPVHESPSWLVAGGVAAGAAVVAGLVYFVANDAPDKRAVRLRLVQ
ncbi:MAG: tetratricopeptide repeat protein [Myxococcales bacterium]|nr:tetratricopeptide repeat protein [Myxococcales bacterium]